MDGLSFAAVGQELEGWQQDRHSGDDPSLYSC